jgi:hypothetical protein
VVPTAFDVIIIDGGGRPGIVIPRLDEINRRWSTDDGAVACADGQPTAQSTCITG